MVPPWRTEPCDVLVVCTGNLCRSPIAATLLAAAAPVLTVRSAGTHARNRQPWHPLAVQALTERGHPVLSGQARRLRVRHVRGARLILTAEGAHRAEVVRLDASAEERCYTLLESARILSTNSSDKRGLDAVLRRLTEGLREARVEHDDDLTDPLLGTIEDFRTCYDTVQRALGVIVSAVVG